MIRFSFQKDFSSYPVESGWVWVRMSTVRLMHSFLTIQGRGPDGAVAMRR